MEGYDKGRQSPTFYREITITFTLQTTNMAKQINLNEKVRVLLTERGLDIWMEEFPYKNRQEIIDNGMWLEDQLWVIISTLNSFSQVNPVPFSEMIFEDSLLETVMLQNEDTDIENLCILAMDTWLGKHYTSGIRRRIGDNPKRPDYITVCVDIIKVLEYKPSSTPGQYHIATAFGQQYPQPEKRTRSLKKVKGMLLRQVRLQPERHERYETKLEREVAKTGEKLTEYMLGK